MRIPIIYLPYTKYKFYIEIKRQYQHSKYIIPIGKDCHAAHSLRVMGLRPQSLPYDWIRLKNSHGLQTVKENITEKFEFFLDNLQVNEDGNTYAQKYPHALFTHAKNIINDQNLQNTFKVRVKRLLSLIDNQDISFLHVVDVGDFSQEDTAYFVSSVKAFPEILKKDDSLHIYLRYDGKIINNDAVNTILKELSNLPQIHITTYDRNKEIDGMWGNEQNYPKLYQKLNLKIKSKFPKIRLTS